MRLTVKTDYTTTDLVPLANCKQQLRIGATYDDANVTIALEAARKEVEADVNRSILNTVYEMKLDYFPDVIYLPMGRIQSVTTITYIDLDGNTQTLVENTDFRVDTGDDEARITYINSWPSDVNTDRKNAITVEYTAGYGATTNTETKVFEMMVLLKLSQIYYNLDSSVSYEMLINKHRLYSLAWYENLNRQSFQLR